MHDRDNPQRFFVGRIRNEVISRIGEAQRTRGQIRAAVTLVGKRNKRFDGRLNCFDHPISSKLAVFGDEFPNSVKINFSFRVKIIPGCRH